MGVGKVIGYCLLIVGAGIAIGIGIAFWVMRTTQAVVEEVSEQVPGFEVLAFIGAILFLFPLALYLIRKQLLKSQTKL